MSAAASLSNSSAKVLREESRLGRWAILAAITLVAFLIRAWRFSTLGLDQFDEGVYALSGFWSLHSFPGPALYVYQKLFAPPGYFALVGIAYLLSGGASDVAAIAVNILFGAATVALAGWAGQRWFGWGCGYAAAILVALSNFHIAFSRSALTDVLFGFCFLLSLALIAISLQNLQPAWAVLAGLTVGAAWNVKYHGWMPVALAFFMLTVQLVVYRKKSADMKHTLFCWLIIAGVALACYVPWMIYSQARLGSYLDIHRFHRHYLNFHFAENFRHQAQMQLYFEGWLSRASPTLALIAALGAAGKPALQRWRATLSAFILSLLFGFLFGGTATCLWLALQGLSLVWRRGCYFVQLLMYSATAFFLLLLCYTPYARLALPWLLFVQILAAVGLSFLIGEAWPAAASASSDTTQNRRQMIWPLTTASLFALILLLVGFRVGPTPQTWNNKDTVRAAVSKMAAVLPRDSVVFVEREPDAAFYFRQAGYQTICIERLSGNDLMPDPFDFADSSAGPVYIVGGLYAHQQVEWNPIPARFVKRMQSLGELAMQPGDVRLLDDFWPAEVLRYRAHPDTRYDLVLFRVNRP